MNLDEVPDLAYIPPFIEKMTDEEHAREELKRYYKGNDLEKAIARTLHMFKVNDYNIKEFDYIEENMVPTFLDNNKSYIRLVWKKRLPLQ